MLALDSQTLSTTATCFQCDGDGRRAGLKIRSSQEGVGSSPTFGTQTDFANQLRKCRGVGRTGVPGGIPRMDSLQRRIDGAFAGDDVRLG